MWKKTYGSIDEGSISHRQNCNGQEISYKINGKDNKANVSIYIALTVKNVYGLASIFLLKFFLKVYGI